MEAIKDIELGALVNEAEATIIDEKKRTALQLVRSHLVEEHKLKTDIAQTEKTLNKQKEQLAQKQALIAKVKAGDWSVLKEKKDEKSKEDAE